MKPETREFLQSPDGLRYIQYICDEYGEWNEEIQQYDMPFDECVALAVAEYEYER